jgi:phosphoribosylanthranilate isomerase
MKLKICGLKYSDNIRQIAELRPDYMGFVFYEKAKRYVGHDFIMPEIPAEIKKTGVFVNASAGFILEKARRYKLDLVQLHGEEDPSFCKTIASDIPVIKAFGIDEEFDLKILDSYKSYCSYFLFDNKTETYGGNAKPFNLSILKDYDNQIPFFIGAGMDMTLFRKIGSMELNVYGVDVNSKMEIKPGYKDIIKIIRIKNNIR